MCKAWPSLTYLTLLTKCEKARIQTRLQDYLTQLINN